MYTTCLHPKIEFNTYTLTFGRPRRRGWSKVCVGMLHPHNGRPHPFPVLQTYVSACIERVTWNYKQLIIFRSRWTKDDNRGAVRAERGQLLMERVRLFSMETVKAFEKHDLNVFKAFC